MRRLLHAALLANGMLGGRRAMGVQAAAAVAVPPPVSLDDAPALQVRCASHQPTLLPALLATPSESMLGWQAAHYFSPTANWLIPQRVLLGRYPASGRDAAAAPNRQCSACTLRQRLPWQHGSCAAGAPRSPKRPGQAFAAGRRRGWRVECPHRWMASAASLVPRLELCARCVSDVSQALIYTSWQLLCVGWLRPWSLKYIHLMSAQASGRGDPTERIRGLRVDAKVDTFVQLQAVPHAQKAKRLHTSVQSQSASTRVFKSSHLADTATYVDA